MILGLVIACLMVGAIVGLLAASLMHVNPTNDTERLDTMQAMGWFTAHTGGRWAVVRDIKGTPQLVAPSQETLREAIDVAMGVSTHG